MRRSHLCEALVLKMYDTGEADRLCVLLTDSFGRLAVTAKGVRRLGSRFGGVLQSFRHLRVTVEEHHSGWYLRSAECLESFTMLQQDLERFFLASEGSDLLLHILHDTAPDPDVFLLALEYFRCVDEKVSPLLFPTLQLSLLTLLGFLPRIRESPSLSSLGIRWHLLHELSKTLHAYLASTLPFPERVRQALSQQDRMLLERLCEALLQDHLSWPLRSVSLSRSFARSSSSVTPISS